MCIPIFNLYYIQIKYYHCIQFERARKVWRDPDIVTGQCIDINSQYHCD